MNAQRFLEGFMTDTLGRKKVNGSWRILNGDHCRLLVRQTTDWGKPAGNDLIAIEFKSELDRLVFAPRYITSNSYRNQMQLRTVTERYQELPNGIRTNSEEILNSGIVDQSSSHVLIEIGDEPYLFYLKKEKEQGARTEGDTPRVEFARPLPRRAASITEALKLIKTPPNNIDILGQYWGEAMPDNFTPPPIDPVVEKVLEEALNPLNYGFTMEELTVSDTPVGGTLNISKARPLRPLIENSTTTRSRQWNEAVVRHNEAHAILHKRYPKQYKKLTIKKAKWGDEEEYTGQIVVTTLGTYVTGMVRDAERWINTQILDGWYKLNGECPSFKF